MNAGDSAAASQQDRGTGGPREQSPPAPFTKGPQWRPGAAPGGWERRTGSTGRNGAGGAGKPGGLAAWGPRCVWAGPPAPWDSSPSKGGQAGLAMDPGVRVGLTLILCQVTITGRSVQGPWHHSRARVCRRVRVHRRVVSCMCLCCMHGWEGSHDPVAWKHRS